MRNTIVGIFAHPDDEAFGPGGTLAKLAKTNDVYIICATNGQAGKSSIKSKKPLEKIRVDELRASAKVLGIRKVYFLGFEDGSLSNNLYHKLAAKIKIHLVKLKPETIITFEPRGITGHIDHITVSLVSSFLFWKLSFIKSLWQFCTVYDETLKQDYFIFLPPGYKKNDIDKIVKIDDVWETKVQAMLCHKSQRHDLKRILKASANAPKEEYFLVTSK